MKLPLFEIDDLTINEAILFAFRYHLIDDCQPEGQQYRLVLGNQSLLFTQDELSVYLQSLLRSYERAVQMSDPGDTPLIES